MHYVHGIFNHKIFMGTAKTTKLIKILILKSFKEYECYVPYKVEQDMYVRIYIST